MLFFLYIYIYISVKKVFELIDFSYNCICYVGDDLNVTTGTKLIFSYYRNVLKYKYKYLISYFLEL